MSINLLLQNETDVVWRGPVIACGNSVLDRRDMERRRLYVYRYASGQETSHSPRFRVSPLTGRSL